MDETAAFARLRLGEVGVFSGVGKADVVVEMAAKAGDEDGVGGQGDEGFGREQFHAFCFYRVVAAEEVDEGVAAAFRPHAGELVAQAIEEDEDARSRRVGLLCGTGFVHGRGEAGDERLAFLFAPKRFGDGADVVGHALFAATVLDA